MAPPAVGDERPERLSLRRVGGGSESGEARRNALLAEALRARSAEIEHAVLARVHAISDPAEVGDPAYAEGLRTSVSAALDYALAVIERGEDSEPLIPPALLAQARLAARHDVGLDTVLRRYAAGYLLLSDFLLSEAEAAGIRGEGLQRLLRTQAVLDRLFVAVSEEHGRELAQRFANGREERRTERVRRLLAGEPLDTAELAYDLEGHHLGLVATGSGAVEAIRALARSLDRRLLAVCAGEEEFWAWLGGRAPTDPAEVLSALASPWPGSARLALGEPGERVQGWRLSHRQAKAALTIARWGPEPAVRYADVALLAATLKDELLVDSLREMYLEPLAADRDGGQAARETLGAYFAAGRNVSSAAESLGIRRQTVASRLRTIERRIGSPIDRRAAELEVALKLSRVAPAA